MELFSPEFFSALAAIIVIDLVLAGTLLELPFRGLHTHRPFQRVPRFNTGVTMNHRRHAGLGEAHSGTEPGHVPDPGNAANNA